MRKYNYVSILLILIVDAILEGILQNIFDGNLLIIAGFVSFIFDYIICRGLLYNREGSFSDYISGIKTMTGKVFLMNILAGAIAVILLTLAMLASGAGFLFTSYSVENPKVFVSFVVLFTLAIIFTSLLFAYMNFFMADDRYRDLAFFKSLKLIVKAGIKLFSESFMAGVKAYKITLISTAIVIVVLLFTPVAGQIALIFGVIAVIALFFCTPTFRASLSDIYLDRSEEIYEEVMGNKN
ncbi:MULTISPECIES: hypothetical protein [Peptoniphilus]|uniref:hypothetical protein n=1 Tax=Peptoniphilus TaxID=162289 RepID=UPI000785B67D|nr:MULTISPECIES: hypothetical protein [Peptoniphilus]KXB69163.1 hypothetical protein HMPREF1864_01496 [Peptoniphilus sp. DNF00840]